MTADPPRQQPLQGPFQRKPSYVSRPDGGEGRIKWEEFPARFQRSAQKIVDKMASNLNVLASTAKKAVEKMGDDLRGKNRD
jgi:hypothetical protein